MAISYPLQTFRPRYSDRLLLKLPWLVVSETEADDGFELTTNPDIKELHWGDMSLNPDVVPFVRQAPLTLALEASAGVS